MRCGGEKKEEEKNNRFVTRRVWRWKTKKKEEDERRAEKETRGKGWRRGGKGNDLKGEEGRRREGVPPLSADKRQKWMNPIGWWASCSLLSPRLHELRTHFIEICEIRKAGYRVIYHPATPAHTSSWLHNKIHNWHCFFLSSLTIICCRSYKAAVGDVVCYFQGQTNLDWIQELRTLYKTAEVAHKSPGKLSVIACVFGKF